MARAARADQKTVEEWLSKQKNYTLYRDKLKRRYPFWKYNVQSIDQQWSADLADMQQLASSNRGDRYILFVIDVFSKFAWARPLKTKTGRETTEAMRSIFDQTGRQPTKMNFDAGTEFLNNNFKDLLKTRGVNWTVSLPPLKAAVVERLIRTVKTKLWRYFARFDTNNWTDVLSDFMTAYNGAEHSTIKRTPDSVTFAGNNDLWFRTFRKICQRSRTDKPKYKSGDAVRVLRARGPLEKGYANGWSEKIYEISKAVVHNAPIAYKLIVRETGAPVAGVFYEHNLQKIRLEQEPLVPERVLARQMTGAGRVFELVKFVGRGKKESKWRRITS